MRNSTPILSLINGVVDLKLKNLNKDSEKFCQVRGKSRGLFKISIYHSSLLKKLSIKFVRKRLIVLEKVIKKCFVTILIKEKDKYWY